MVDVNELQLISAKLREAGVPGVLVGGFAVQCYKFGRATEDIDFMMTEEDYGKVLPLLNKSGYQEILRQNLFARLRNLGGPWLDVDILFVDRETMFGILSQSKEAVFGSEKFRIPSLMHLIAMKLHALKNNPERELKDLVDIVEMAKKNEIDVGSESFRQMCLKFGNEDLYQKILEFKRP